MFIGKLYLGYFSTNLFRFQFSENPKGMWLWCLDLGRFRVGWI